MGHSLSLTENEYLKSMKRQIRATKECFTLSEGLYDSMDSAYQSMSSSMMSIADQKTLNEPRTFDSWEDYHRSDTTKTGLLFLYIYLRDRPGRQSDAEVVLKQYYNGVDICTKPATAPMTLDDLTGPTWAEDKGNSTDDVDSAVEDITDDDPDEENENSETTPTEEKSISPVVSEKKETQETKVAMISMKNDVRNVQLYADINDWKPISMTLESGKRTWSVHVSPKLGEYKFLVHEKKGTSFWATDSESMLVRKPPTGALNNIAKYEGGPVFSIVRDDDGTTELTIKSNQECAFASNYHKFRDAKTIAVHTDADWKVGHEMELVEGDWKVILPSQARQCKFVLDGYRWTTLDQMPFVGNQGWNCNNVLQAVYRQI